MLILYFGGAAESPDPNRRRNERCEMPHDGSAPREFYQCYRYLSAVVHSSHPAATAAAKQNAAKQRTHMYLGVCRGDFRLDGWIWSERVTCSLDTGVVTEVYATTRRSYSIIGCGLSQKISSYGAFSAGCLCFDVSAYSDERTGYPKECVDKSQTQRADYQSSFV